MLSTLKQYEAASKHVYKVKTPKKQTFIAEVLGSHCENHSFFLSLHQQLVILTWVMKYILFS